MMISYIKKTLLLCLVLCTTLLVGCSDDKDEVTPLPDSQGEVTFKFVRNKVYDISTLEEMARLKVTLEKDGKKITLPTIDLSGDIDSLSTPSLRLDNGEYKVVKYVAYNSKGNQIQEGYLDEDNALTIEHNRIATFYFPISIRIVYVNNQLRNMLFGICAEVLGADSTKWPKTWRVENEDLLTWENLEFSLDDLGNIEYLAGIIFNEKFAGMKKLPNTVSLFPTLEHIQIMDLPEFEELPDNLNESKILSISIYNTGLKSFPKNFEKMVNLHGLTIQNSKLTELPVRLGELKLLTDISISGNQISSFPTELVSKWENLQSLRMSDTKLVSLPANFFEMKKVVTVDLSNNPGLNTLPAINKAKNSLVTLLLDNCGFTSIPQIAESKITSLSLSNNKLTSVSVADFGNLYERLSWLCLDGNKIGSFPKMATDKLIGISLNNCGLTAVPDLSALPSLRMLNLAKNQIATIEKGTLGNNKLLSILDLSDNASLTSISDEAGFNMVPQQDTHGGVTVTVSKPYYLNAVNVDNCPKLVWNVPATWCCVKNIYVENKDGALLPVRNVVVYNRNSPGVTREKCPICGKSVYTFPKSIEDMIKEAKANSLK